MLKISSPIAPLAIVAVVLVSTSDVSGPAGSAYANDCIAAPKNPSPRGQHWYYRVEHATGHKCWYLHAFLSRPHRTKQSETRTAAASTIAKPKPAPQSIAEPKPVSESVAGPKPVPQAVAAGPKLASQRSADAPNPAGDGDSTVRRPEIKILAVRPVQFADPPTDQGVQQNTPQQTGMPSVYPASTGNEDTTPLNTPDSADTVNPTADVENPGPPNAAANSPGNDAASKPQAIATIGPTEMYFLIVLGIGLAAFVIGVVIKIASNGRALPISEAEDPDTAWRRYRLRDQRPDLEASSALASPARTRSSAKQSEKPVSTLVVPSAVSLKELEPALRALGEARQHEVA